MSTAPTNVSEYDVIANVVQHYIDGGKSGKGDDMKPAFHPDATIFGYAGADLFAGPIQQLFAWVDGNDHWLRKRPSRSYIQPRIVTITKHRLFASICFA